MVENLPAMQETQVRHLGWEDSPGERNGNPLQYSCLENTMTRGAFCYRCINRPSYKQILPSIVISNLSC